MSHTPSYPMIQKIPRTILIKKNFKNEYTYLSILNHNEIDAVLLSPNGEILNYRGSDAWNEKLIRLLTHNTHYSQKTLQYLQWIKFHDKRDRANLDNKQRNMNISKLDALEYTKKKSYQHNLPFRVDIELLIKGWDNDYTTYINGIFIDYMEKLHMITTLGISMNFRYSTIQHANIRFATWEPYMDIRTRITLQLLKSQTILKLTHLRALCFDLNFHIGNWTASSVSESIELIMRVSSSRIKELEYLRISGIYMRLSEKDVNTKVVDIIKRLSCSRFLYKFKRLVISLFAWIIPNQEDILTIIKDIHSIITGLPVNTPLIVLIDIPRNMIYNNDQDWIKLIEACPLVKQDKITPKFKNNVPGNLALKKTKSKSLNRIQISHAPLRCNSNRYLDAGGDYIMATSLHPIPQIP